MKYCSKYAPWVFLFAIIAGLLLLSGAVLAQSGGGYEIVSWSVDNGGGRSNGGGYEVGGAIGQPDASARDALAGGPYRLSGGFLGPGTDAPTAIGLLSTALVTEKIPLALILIVAVLTTASLVSLRKITGGNN